MTTKYKQLYQQWIIDYNSGLNCKEISDKYNIYKGTIWSFLKRNGLGGKQPIEKRVMKKISKTDSCWEWTGTKDGGGYGIIKCDGVYKYVHRIMYELHKENIPEGMIIRHKCDNPSCVNPQHLEVGTHCDNARDRDERQRNVKGERVHTAKLTESDVSEIRMLIKNGLSNKEVAIIFNVSDMTISGIKTNRTWKHVEIKE
jgi:hypothetical protein